MTRIVPQPLTSTGFAAFGDVIECSGKADQIINQGMCGRFHDRAVMDFGTGRAGLSLFDATPRSFPYSLDLMERHPLGSQAFIPMHRNPFLVIVAEDAGGKPAAPLAFLTSAGQGVNIHRNTWHGVLTPLAAPGLFAVIDRIGDGNNLEEFEFDAPIIVAPVP